MKLFNKHFGSVACGALLAASVVTGCGGSSQDVYAPSTQVVSPNPPVLAEVDFPGEEVVGEAGDSTVYRVGAEIYVVTEVETEWFLENFPEAVPVPGARIVFPDGSELTADPNGDFDASQSRYASSGASQDDRFDTEVTVIPPAELGLASSQADLVVPTAEEDATLEVVLIDENAVPEEPPVPGPMPDVRAQGYIWSTNPADYLASQGRNGSAEWVSAFEDGPLYLRPTNASAVKFTFKFNNLLTWFDIHAYVAGTDQPAHPGLRTNAVAYKSTTSVQWRCSVYRDLSAEGVTGLAAIWVSPNHYFGSLSHNVHLVLVQH